MTNDQAPTTNRGNSPPTLVIGAWSLVLMLLLPALSRAAEPPPAAAPGDESAQYTVETLLTGLDNPASLAVRPGAPPQGPFDLYLSESGAGRIVRLSSAEPAETTPVVTGFPLGDFGDKPSFRVGPLGLEFLSPNRLAVGTGGLGAGKELVHVYALPEDNSPLAYDKFDHSAGPVPAGSRSATGEGAFISIAKTEEALFVAAGSGDSRGWVLKAILDANRLADLQPFIATSEVAGVGGPRVVIINPKANYHYLVVGEAGAPSPERDSRITMFNPANGELALNLNAGLHDLVGLAYSPGGDLYAIDCSAAKPENGGVYRVDAAMAERHQSCRPVKIASVIRPMALAFTPDSALYITALGPHTNPNDKPTGTLLKITPKPDAPKL